MVVAANKDIEINTSSSASSFSDNILANGDREDYKQGKITNLTAVLQPDSSSKSHPKEGITSVPVDRIFPNTVEKKHPKNHHYENDSA